MNPKPLDGISRWCTALVLGGLLFNCSPSERSKVLGPLEWEKVDQIALAALQKRFPKVDRNRISAEDFRLYTYELDHNGNPREEFIQSFEYRDPKKKYWFGTAPSIGCWISTSGEVSIPDSRTVPFRPTGEEKFTPVKLSHPLKTPDFQLIDSLAKTAVSNKVAPENLVFRSLTVGYRKKSSTESYAIQFYDSSSVRTKVIEGRTTMFYTWVRIKMDGYGNIKDIMWHTPAVNLEGRNKSQIANQPFPPASVSWPPNH